MDDEARSEKLARGGGGDSEHGTNESRDINDRAMRSRSFLALLIANVVSKLKAKTFLRL